MSVKQKTEEKTIITNGCSVETESKEEKAEELVDKKCNQTPKNTRKSLLKEKNSNSKIPTRIKEPECPQTAKGKARTQKVTFDANMGVLKTNSESKQQQKETKAVSIEKISKEVIPLYKTEGLKTSNNSTKDCTDAMKSLTIDKRRKSCEKNRNSTTLQKTSPIPKMPQEPKNVSPKLPLVAKPKKDSAHSGLTFKPNVMKGTVPKPFKFESRPKVVRSKSVNESSSVSKIKKRTSSVCAKKFAALKDQPSKDVKAKTPKLEDKKSPASILKSKTPEASSADSKNAPLKKYSAFGGLRFKPKRVSTQSKADIFDSKVVPREEQHFNTRNEFLMREKGPA